MGRVVPLTDNKIKGLKPEDKRKPDGEGLYIHISPTGTKTFKFHYELQGKRNTKTIGRYPAISLKQARDKRELYRSMVANGLKPEDTTASKPKKKQLTFRELTEEYHKHRDDLSCNYIKDSTNVLEHHFPMIMDKELDSITIDDFIDAFKLMNKLGNSEAARKAGSLIKRIFTYGIMMRYTDNNPAIYDVKMIVKKRKQKNFAHITDEKKLQELLKVMSQYVGKFYVAKALQLMPYVFLRPINVAQLEWSEIDFKKKLITIPAAKMKTDSDHIVPLTDSMISILRECNTGTSRWVFPNDIDPMRPISRDTLSAGLRRMGFAGEMTSHGYRHTAATILHENKHIIGVTGDAIEMQMAHNPKGSVEGVYNKAEYIVERKRLMQWWSDYLDRLISQPL